MTSDKMRLRTLSENTSSLNELSEKFFRFIYMTCKFCHRDNKNLVIKEYDYWTSELCNNQAYLGRCLVILKRHTEDLFDITKDEAEELFNISKSTRDSLVEIFKPDLFNYGSLGNFIKHVHLHIIPRYSKPRLFNGMEFVDAKWGDFYYPYDKNFKTSDAILANIVDKIQGDINKSKK